MPVFRVEKTKNFTTMSNFHLRDGNLSLKAKGLLSLMLSLPESWDYSLSGLAHICKDGKEAVRSAVAELESFGYVRREQARDGQGRLGKNIYTIYEQPPTETLPPVVPSAETPATAFSKTENRAQLNTYKKIKEKENIDYSNQSINKTDRYETIENYKKTILENIDYEIISSGNVKERVDEIVEIMLECLCSANDTVRVAKEYLPSELVKSRFLKINSEHVLYVLECFGANTTKVRNVKEYLKTALYNAPATMSHFYTAAVNHDLYSSAV